LRRKTDCVRILEEYKARNEPQPGVLQRLWDSLWNSKEELDAFPEGIIDDIDVLKEFLGELEGYKQRIEQIMTLFEGINTDDPEARAEAFKVVMDLAKELGDRVPGFGDMIGFYAEAYNAAMEAIAQIAEEIRKPAKEAIDGENISCNPDNWHEKSLEDILEQEWRKFLQTPQGSTYVEIRLSPSQQRVMEKYFKDRAAKLIMECCIYELLK
jgi:hypothetical protein